MAWMFSTAAFRSCWELREAEEEEEGADVAEEAAADEPPPPPSACSCSWCATVRRGAEGTGWEGAERKKKKIVMSLKWVPVS